MARCFASSSILDLQVRAALLSLSPLPLLDEHLVGLAVVRLGRTISRIGWVTLRKAFGMLFSPHLGISVRAPRPGFPEECRVDAAFSK